MTSSGLPTELYSCLWNGGLLLLYSSWMWLKPSMSLVASDSPRCWLTSCTLRNSATFYVCSCRQAELCTPWGTQRVTSSDWTGIGFTDVCFMDDDLTWAPSVPVLQNNLDAFSKILASWGLTINPSKCQLLTRGDVKGDHLSLNGVRIQAVEEDKGISVMGLPVKSSVTPFDQVSSLLTRARKNFWSNKPLLLSHAPLIKRLNLLYRTVWGSMSWILGAITPSQNSLHLLSGFLFQCVALMPHVTRKPGETFVDHKCRSYRLARYLLQQRGFERWSTLHLRLAWRYAGHRARAIHYAVPNTSAILSHFRTPEWWAEQQSLQDGYRHARRHYPRITLEENMFASIFKGKN